MKDDAAPAFKPAEVPDGLEPRWERRYPGRLVYELDALRRVGVTLEIDLEALERGQLALSFDWRLNAQTTLRLKALYPDGFPHLRPQVFLLSGLDPPPVRHRSPIEGNLCLLGRDTRQWMPSWTLCELLSKQLADAVHGTGDEDLQGEPADFWWNQVGPRGSYCLIDSRWKLGDIQSGSLVLRVAVSRDPKGTRPRDRRPTSTFRAIVTQVQDREKNVLYDWEGPMPPELLEGKPITIPWVRSEKTIFPDAKLDQQADALVQKFPRLQHQDSHVVADNLTVKLFAVAHSVEVGFGEIGLGWVVFLSFGHANSFKVRAKERRKHPPPTVTVLPTYRAGPQDIGFRVPALQALRSKRILVVGIGAVGAPTAVELARNGCGILHLLDHDVVEPGTTVRWPLGSSAWGASKLDALKAFLSDEYPATEVNVHPHHLGQVSFDQVDAPSDDDVLDAILPYVDLVIDGSASHGVTTLLAERCRGRGLPLISLFATPNLEGGAVVLFGTEGGCPICLEYAWDGGQIGIPPGRDDEDPLVQPPGCAERTFLGAGYDLQELSLQTIRLAVETLCSQPPVASLLQTLSFADEEGQRCPPRWCVEPLPKHPQCPCKA